MNSGRGIFVAGGAQHRGLPDSDRLHAREPGRETSAMAGSKYPAYYARMRTSLALIALVSASAFADTPQQHVHDMSHEVMPFDMSKTLHVFIMNDQGGIQKVVVREKAGPEQINLIRQRL